MSQLDEIVRAFERAVAHPASPLHFTPVAVRARIDGWTPDRQRTYVAALAATGRADRAAAHVGMTSRTAARLMARADGRSIARACQQASTIAKRVAREAAARAEGGKGPEGPKGSERFRPMGSSRTTRTGPFGPSAAPRDVPDHR